MITKKQPTIPSKNQEKIPGDKNKTPTPPKKDDRDADHDSKGRPNSPFAN